MNMRQVIDWFRKRPVMAIEPIVELEPSPADRLPDDPIRNGVHAEQLLNDPLLKQCFENVRLSYLKKFERTSVGDIEGLKMVQLSLTALIDVKRALLTYRFNGQTAQSQQGDTTPQRSRPMRTN